MKYYLLFTLYLLIKFVAASHGTCRPEHLVDGFKLYKLGLGDKKELYDCVVKDGNEITKIACAVDIPLLTDDAIVFKARRNTYGTCNKRVCENANTRINTYLYKPGYPGKSVSVLDIRHTDINIYHICQRYQLGNERCDVNFDLLGLEYYNKRGHDFYKFITEILGWPISKKKN